MAKCPGSKIRSGGNGKGLGTGKGKGPVGVAEHNAPENERWLVIPKCMADLIKAKAKGKGPIGIPKK